MSSPDNSATALRIKQFDAGGSGYARRIKDTEWEQYRHIIDLLGDEGLTRRDILRTLQARHGFFPTYGQLNAKMTLWQREKAKDAVPRAQEAKGKKPIGNSTHETLIADLESDATTSFDPESLVPDTSDDFMVNIQLLTNNEKHSIPESQDTEVTGAMYPIYEQPSDHSHLISETDAMSVCSSGSTEFKHFSRYAASLRDQPAATCYTSRSSRSSSSSHSSWGFEEVTGYPADSPPIADTQYPFYRIRSGMVLGATTTPVATRPPRKNRPVIIHQANGPTFDVQRTSDMAGSRWR